MTVVIVDDHPPVREGVKAALRRYDNIAVVGEAETGYELLSLLEHISPDIIVLDISLPDMSGIELLRHIKKVSSRIKVLMLSMFNSSDYILETVRAGADGYMTKETSPLKIVNGIEQIMEGEYFFDKPAMSVILAKALEKPDFINSIVDDAYNSLTGREQEIMRYLAEGNSVRQIAQALYISYRTVENHKTAIFRKLNITNLAKLVHYAAKIGVIQID